MGPAGPMGLPGIAGANGVSGYEIAAGETQAASYGVRGTVRTFEVPCPSGKVPVSGGHEPLNDFSQWVTVITSMPVNTATFSGWRFQVQNAFYPGALTGVQLRLHVVCATMGQ